MPPSRRLQRSRTKPSQGLQGGRLGQQRKTYVQRWNVRFGELFDYRSEHGSCDVPRSQGKLGTWVNHQRKAFMAGSLAQDRIDRLNGIGFAWTRETAPTVWWETRFKELVQYKAKHGNCNVPQRQGLLGTWVSTQRRNYMAGSLAQDRIDRLNGIGFQWALCELWETRFNELVRYKAKHGNCNVPRSQGKLGPWVHNQRSVYMDDSLAQDRIDRLNGIGFQWALMKSAKVPWETRFNELVQNKAKHGNCNVPQSQGTLGKWVNNQRSAYSANSLAQDRVDRLNGIGFDWTPPRGGSRKRKAPSSTRKQSLSRKERTPSPVADGGRSAEPNRLLGKKHNVTSVLLRKVPSKRSSHNLGTESDDEDDEIGALIYDQVMRNRQLPQALRSEGVLIKTEEIETESETETDLFKSEEVPVKTEEKIKYSCETDDESALD